VRARARACVLSSTHALLLTGATVDRLRACNWHHRYVQTKGSAGKYKAEVACACLQWVGTEMSRVLAYSVLSEAQLQEKMRAEGYLAPGADDGGSDDGESGSEAESDATSGDD
jgi:hypothetical protein